MVDDTTEVAGGSSCAAGNEGCCGPVTGPAEIVKGWGGDRGQRRKSRDPCYDREDVQWTQNVSGERANEVSSDASQCRHR